MEQGFLILQTPDTPHSIRLLWTRKLPVAETSTCQHTTVKKDKQLYSRRDSNQQSQHASGRKHIL
jgi:hypothetical protein